MRFIYHGREKVITPMRGFCGLHTQARPVGGYYVGGYGWFWVVMGGFGFWETEPSVWLENVISQKAILIVDCLSKAIN